MTTSTGVELQKIEADWKGPVIVAAPGPSLTQDVAKKVRFARWFDGWRIVAVNDAYRLIPTAEVLYACDDRWWLLHEGVQQFSGERWTTHEPPKLLPDGRHEQTTNDKTLLLATYPGIRCVRGKEGMTFSTDPGLIHYGSNSGFQALNFALLKGATRIVLVGFDMRVVNGQAHFFGAHPPPLHTREEYGAFIGAFNVAARNCAVPVFNATPGSLLTCFPAKDLDEAIREVRPRLYGTMANV